MNIIIGETLSSATRVKQIAALRHSVHFLVNGTVEPLVADPSLPITIMVLAQRQWQGLWTRWQHDYRMPPLSVAESTWALVSDLLAKRTDVPRKFGGAFAHGFVWGMVPGAVGVCARERDVASGGGLFHEHYMLCRLAGLAPEASMAFTVEMAVRGGTTPLPKAKS